MNNPEGEQRRRRRNANGHRPRQQQPGALEIARDAVRQLAELLGRQPEGIIAVNPDEDGWLVEIEVLEARRIPNTTDVLACYQARLDQRGRLRGYQRTNRYLRGTLRGGADDFG